MSNIGEIATRIYENEFDDAPTELEREFRIEAISGWLDGNIGQLNNLTYQSFGTEDHFLLEEENILTQLYLKDYYTRQARVVLMGATTGSMQWTRLTEGDTTIVRNSNIDFSREYKALAKHAAEELKDLVYSYNSYQAMPRQVAGFDGGWETTGNCKVTTTASPITTTTTTTTAVPVTTTTPIPTSIPSSPDSPGSPCQLAYENDYLYVCTEENSWQRVPMIPVTRDAGTAGSTDFDNNFFYICLGGTSWGSIPMVETIYVDVGCLGDTACAPNYYYVVTSDGWRQIGLATWTNLVSTNIPSAPNSPGTAGEIAFEDDYFYVCTSTNSWQRVAMDRVTRGVNDAGRIYFDTEFFYICLGGTSWGRIALANTIYSASGSVGDTAYALNYYYVYTSAGWRQIGIATWTP